MAMTDLIPNEAEFDALGASILERSIRDDRRRRRRNVTIAAVAAGTALLIGTGAVILATSQMQRDVTYCYEEPDLGSRNTQVATPTDVRDDEGQPVETAIADAVDKCAALWRIGFFESDGVPVDDNTTFEVPELQLCIRPDGVPAVLPRGQFDGSDEAFCTQLRMESP